MATFGFIGTGNMGGALAIAAAKAIGGGNLLLPGFKNAHTHSAMTFLRSYADDLPLDEWLNRKVFPMEAKLDEEKIYWLAQLAFLEYLTGGITTAFDNTLIRYKLDIIIVKGFHTKVVTHFKTAPFNLVC